MYKLLLLLSVTALILASQQSCCDVDTLSIIGAGKVQVDPDLVSFSLTASAQAKTSLAALSQVNLILQDATKILSRFGLSKKDFTTSSIRLNPQYDFVDGDRILRGQSASQTLRVTIRGIQSKVNAVGKLVTSLSAIEDLSVGGLSFDSSDPRAAYKQARWAAISDAKKKAREYAQLSDRALAGVKRVIDSNRESLRPFRSDFNTFSLKSQTLEVPYGKVEVQSRVEIVWGISN